MGRLIDLTGKRFGRLVAIKYLYNDKNRNAVWLCKCNCGNYTEKNCVSLRMGSTLSCGCLKKENAHKLGISEKSDRTKHGKRYTRIYNIYCGMKQRCYYSKSSHYKYYGGRGIKICEDWLNDFMNFYNWAMENGYRDYLTIDRKDVNGNYEPSNCRWATLKEQASNKRPRQKSDKNKLILSKL